MSHNNVEIVRRHFAAFQQAFERYWENPQSTAAALERGDIRPEEEDYLRHLDPELEWNPIFSTEPLKGLLECARAWDDWFEAAQDYKNTLLEVSELGDEQVLAVIEGAFVGKSTGIHVNATVFVLMTLRDGRIVRADEYLERGEALEAAGLRE
jgi:ketosteroid isomerase-like protein